MLPAKTSTTLVIIYPKWTKFVNMKNIAALAVKVLNFYPEMNGYHTILLLNIITIRLIITITVCTYTHYGYKTYCSFLWLNYSHIKQTSEEDVVDACNPQMFADLDVDQTDLLKGDAIGNTLYSERFVLKTLIRLSQVSFLFSLSKICFYCKISWYMYIFLIVTYLTRIS